jgi:hypothetical protein
MKTYEQEECIYSFLVTDVTLLSRNQLSDTTIMLIESLVGCIQNLKLYPEQIKFNFYATQKMMVFISSAWLGGASYTQIPN